MLDGLVGEASVKEPVREGRRVGLVDANVSIRVLIESPREDCFISKVY
ncbi:MAG: hypothetical protein N3H31_06455 [Candidatus Nezhaarchaeota archaeon]|nr:hypothetical protein [Candidatus Nezhaarchaeota archaeon]